jgi:hypothetical protein
VPEYLVEAYDPHQTADAAERARAAATAHVRYRRTIFVPPDESCLHVFEAPTATLLREALDAAGLGYDRIVEARDA